MLAGAAAPAACAADTTAGVTVTLAVCVSAVPFAVADTVFGSATLELSVPVATPLAVVAAAGWVSLLPLPVAASTTGAPAIAFPCPSLALNVIVVSAQLGNSVVRGE